MAAQSIKSQGGLRASPPLELFQVRSWAIPPLIRAPSPRRPLIPPPVCRSPDGAFPAHASLPCPHRGSLRSPKTLRPSSPAGGRVPAAASLTWAPAPRPAGSPDPRSSSAPPAQQPPGSRGARAPERRRADFGDEKARAVLRRARGRASSWAPLARHCTRPSHLPLGLGGVRLLEPGTRGAPTGHLGALAAPGATLTPPPRF